MSHAAIEKIYQTIEDPEIWPQALQAVADALNSVGGLIMILLPNRSRIALPSPGIAVAAADYIENWAARDIRSNRLDDRKLHLTHETVVDEDVVSPAEMDTDPFYSIFLKKHDLRYFCASAWAPTRDSSVALSVQRSPAQGEYSPSDRQEVLMLGRHIERAIKLRGRFLEEQARRETLEAIVDGQELAVIMTDQTGCVKFTNDAARKLPKELLTIVGGRLRFGASAPSAQILELMRQVSEGNLAATSRTIFISARGDSSGFALNMMLRPPRVANDFSGGMDGSPTIVILLTSIRVAHDFDVAITRDFLRLNLGEARVAAQIASGKSPDEVAANLGLTRETVRFTLKQVYNKTGFRRQNQLSAALNALRKLPAGPLR